MEYDQKMPVLRSRTAAESYEPESGSGIPASLNSARFDLGGMARKKGVPNVRSKTRESAGGDSTPPEPEQQAAPAAPSPRALKGPSHTYYSSEVVSHAAQDPTTELAAGPCKFLLVYMSSTRTHERTLAQLRTADLRLCRPDLISSPRSTCLHGYGMLTWLRLPASSRVQEKRPLGYPRPRQPARTSPLIPSSFADQQRSTRR